MASKRDQHVGVCMTAEDYVWSRDKAEEECVSHSTFILRLVRAARRRDAEERLAAMVESGELGE